MEENNSPEGTQDAGSQTDNPDRQYSKAEFEEVVKARQEAKENFRKVNEELEKFRAAEADKKKKELEAKGNYEAILKEYEEKVKSYEEKVSNSEKFINEIKADLLSQLPEEHQEIAGGLGLEELRKYVKLNAKKETTSTDVTRAGGNKSLDLVGKTFDDFTREELNKLKQSNYSAYAALFKAKYGMIPVK